MATQTVSEESWGKVIKNTWVNGVLKSMCKEVCISAVVSTGLAVFILTKDGTINGEAIFTNVYKESANFWVDNPLTQYQFGGYILSGDKKTLTITVNQLGNVVLGIINYITAANGVTVYLRIKGD